MSVLPTVSSAEITTERLVLRKAREADRESLVELQVDPAVRLYLGGPRARAAVERDLAEAGVAGATSEPGAFVIADKTSDQLLGYVALARRSRSRPGHVLDQGDELELSYGLRRTSWGAGLAFEAAWSVLHAAAAELPDQPVLIVTQTANQRSLKLAGRLGFEIVDTFQEHGASQALCVASLHRFADDRSL